MKKINIWNVHVLSKLNRTFQETREELILLSIMPDLKTRYLNQYDLWLPATRSVSSRAASR